MLELIVAVAFIMLSWPRPVQSCSSSPGRYSLMDGPLWISIMDTDACNTQNCILKRLRNNMPYASVRSMKKAEYFKLRFDLTGQAYEGFYLQSNDLRCGIMCVGENRVSLQTFLWCSRLSQESSNGRSWRDELVAVEDDGLGAIDMMSFGPRNSIEMQIVGQRFLDEDPSLSLRCYERARELDPSRTEPYLAIARAMIARGESADMIIRKLSGYLAGAPNTAKIERLKDMVGEIEGAFER